MKTYKSISNDKCGFLYGEIASGYYEEKKSKFYSYIFNINNDDDAISYIERVKKENKDARHIIYIYSYMKNNLCIKFSDDGEPQGTGTRAIYDILNRESITNVCIVIVRYFGGVLLGAGPLARAYLNTFRDSLKSCETTDIMIYDDISIKMSYNSFGKIKNTLDKYKDQNKIIVKSISYDTDISLSLSVERSIKEEVINIIDSIK